MSRLPINKKRRLNVKQVNEKDSSDEESGTSEEEKADINKLKKRRVKEIITKKFCEIISRIQPEGQFWYVSYGKSNGDS